MRWGLLGEAARMGMLASWSRPHHTFPWPWNNVPPKSILASSHQCNQSIYWEFSDTYESRTLVSPGRCCLICAVFESYIYTFCLCCCFFPFSFFFVWICSYKLAVSPLIDKTTWWLSEPSVQRVSWWCFVSIAWLRLNLLFPKGLQNQLLLIMSFTYCSNCEHRAWRSRGPSNPLTWLREFLKQYQKLPFLLIIL